MTDLKRKPKPMTEKQIAQYQELKDNLMAQAELIMAIFHPLDDREHVTEVMFYMGHPMGPQIEIYYAGYAYGEDYNEFFPCPESYLGMTADELKAEKTRLEEEEKRKKAEMVAKAMASREKRIKEKEKKEKEKRHKKYLELKAEFEGEDELGHWGFLKYDEACCSKCGHVISLPFYSTKEAKEKWNTELPAYCEKCGAKMKQESEGKEQ